ncbi:MAG: helix-turn-helix domain-containing protein [Candidatus Bipolaricaulota bacterium]|nr:helix-turn-helix domain-containing protein [Candidatus Bipolaricaulota bacterium]
MTLEDKVHAFRLHILRRAEELGNVSAACREAGISRTMFYRWKQRFALYGSDGLHCPVSQWCLQLAASAVAEHLPPLAKTRLHWFFIHLVTG